jgi:DNA-binding CsgD family transcriptional regulator
VPTSADDYWLINDEAFVKTTVAEDRLEVAEVHPIARFGEGVMEREENVIPLTDSLILFCLADGFVIYHQGALAAQPQYNSVIQMSTVRSKETLFPLQPESVPVLPYNENHIQFTVEAPVYHLKKVMFSYYLEGLDTAWSKPQVSPMMEYLRLPQGDYVFHARFIDDTGNNSEAIAYPFEIAKPWYMTTAAIVAYFVLFIAAYLLLGWYNQRNFARRQRALRIKLEREKLQQLRLHREQHEKQLMKYRNEKLQNEVEHKVGQLASSTIGMIKKNEVLMKIKDEIIKHRRELESASGNRFVKSLLKVINDNISSEEDWSVFEQNFDQAHDDFLRALRTTYPSLTPKDLRFCAYLRMNLSSKEIASLLNITVRGVEIRRYRLRKKLGLDHEKNLVEFMMEM